MKITRQALENMTVTQLYALQEMFEDGQWESVDWDDIHVYLEPVGTAIMVNVAGFILIGIEADGYTHS